MLNPIKSIHKRRVVVTGIGIVNALGLDTPTTWSGILAGKSGIAPIRHCDVSNLPVRFAGCIPDFTLGSFKTKHIKRMDLFIQYGLQSAQEAILDAKLEHNRVDKSRIGVSIGSGIGGLGLIEKQHSQLLQAAQTDRPLNRIISPFLFQAPLLTLPQGHVQWNMALKDLIWHLQQPVQPALITSE